MSGESAKSSTSHVESGPHRSFKPLVTGDAGDRDQAKAQKNPQWRNAPATEFVADGFGTEVTNGMRHAAQEDCAVDGMVRTETDDDGSDEMLLDLNDGFLETAPQILRRQVNDVDDSIREMKRPRLQSQATRPASSPAIGFKTPAKRSITATPSFNSAPQFRAFASNPSASSVTAAATVPAPSPIRPRFVAPADSPTTNTTVLPFAFSPHRHRQKERYQPDGWASQVRGWVFDVVADVSSNELVATSLSSVIQLEHVNNVQAGGNSTACAAVTGRLVAEADKPCVHAKAVNVMLVGHAAASVREMHAHDLGPALDVVLQPGMHVRLDVPSWEVEVENSVTGLDSNDPMQIDKWLVCASWKIL